MYILRLPESCAVSAYSWRGVGCRVLWPPPRWRWPVSGSCRPRPAMVQLRYSLAMGAASPSRAWAWFPATYPASPQLDLAIPKTSDCRGTRVVSNEWLLEWLYYRKRAKEDLRSQARIALPPTTIYRRAIIKYIFIVNL